MPNLELKCNVCEKMTHAIGTLRGDLIVYTCVECHSVVEERKAPNDVGSILAKPKSAQESLDKLCDQVDRHNSGEE